VLAVDHRLALNRPALPSAPSKAPFPERWQLVGLLASG
jgi:hypothetical protein